MASHSPWANVGQARMSTQQRQSGFEPSKFGLQAYDVPKAGAPQRLRIGQRVDLPRIQQQNQQRQQLQQMAEMIGQSFGQAGPLSGLRSEQARMEKGLTPIFGAEQAKQFAAQGGTGSGMGVGIPQGMQGFNALLAAQAQQMGLQPQAGFGAQGVGGAGGGLTLAQLMQEPEIMGIQGLYDVGAQNVQRGVGEMMQRAGLLQSGMTAEELSGQMQQLESQRAAAIGPVLQDLIAQQQAGQVAQQAGFIPQQTGYGQQPYGQQQYGQQIGQRQQLSQGDMMSRMSFMR